MYLSCQAEGFCLFILSKVKSVHVCEKRKKKGDTKRWDSHPRWCVSKTRLILDSEKRADTNHSCLFWSTVQCSLWSPSSSSLLISPFRWLMFSLLAFSLSLSSVISWLVLFFAASNFSFVLCSSSPTRKTNKDHAQKGKDCCNVK